ncbi:MAG: GNAT family N-acetyltransferase [bacterium]
MLDICVKLAKKSDGEGFRDVLYQTWLDTYPNTEAGITIEDIKDFFDRIKKERACKGVKKIESGEVRLVAKQGDKVVGVCRLVISEEINKLQSLYVLPEYQGQKIGWRLWQEAQKYFNPQKDIFLGVAEYNKKAQTFYQKLGFVFTGKRIINERFVFKSGAQLIELEMIKQA